MAKKRARARARSIADARRAVEASRQAAADQAAYERMLPAIQAQERIALENQRQMLQRQTDIERNAVLNRLAGAAERSAGYVYPGQSPSVGSFSGPATQLPVNPLYRKRP